MDTSAAAPASCDRLICLVLGYEYQPRRLSIEAGGDELLRLPVVVFLVHGPGGWLLIDTGLSPAMRDRELASTIYRTRVPEFAGAGSDPLLDGLSCCGLTADEIAAVAISHLHVDHTGGLRHFADGRPVFIQRREREFGLDEAGIADAYIRTDYDEPGLGWIALDGDAPLLPGVEALSTPGHTPGHMSFRVRLSDGATWLLAMDAIDLQDGIDSDTPIGSSARPAAADRRASHARLIDIARRHGDRLIPGHCPRVLPTLAPPPEGILTKGRP